jgi:hypothetical protein
MATDATPQQYDPLDYDNLAQNVVRALLEQPRQKLAPAPFEGVGVYALYYLGDLDCYKATRGEDIPIYVGSAVLAGKRKGGKEATAGRTLHNRLVQHAKSIQQAENLRLEDFHCRYLVVVPVWIELAERFLIEHYRPVWNTVIDGFGNHDPGAGRKDMKRPRWDILHPGRGWAKKLKPAETPSKIIADLKSS